MEVKIIEEKEADDISIREESHFFDKKSFAVTGSKIQKVAVAFANADGGELIVGVSDDKEESSVRARWQGAPSIESLNGHLQAIFEITPSLDLRYEILKCRSRDGYVLRVQIEKSPDVHKTGKGDVYQRHGAQSLPLKDLDKITQLSFAKGATTFEDQILKDVEPDQIAESLELRSFLNDYSPATDPLEFCVNQNLFEYKTWAVRVSAALLFHPIPSAVIPRKCAVKITRYETQEDCPDREHLAYQTTLEGPLYSLIKRTVQSVKEIMSSVNVWTTGGLKKLNYPPEAIWEVIVNALIHRDYSISDDTHIVIYNNRIEIVSPGRLPGYVTVDNILDARYARNSKIVRTLNRYKEAPNKDLGEGLNTTFQKMKDWGLKSPEIYEEGGCVKVVLKHVSLATPTEAILDFLENNKAITNQQAREITGIKSENSVKREFYKLRDEGLLERVPGLGGSRSAWRLVDNKIERDDDVKDSQGTLF